MSKQPALFPRSAAAQPDVSKVLLGCRHCQHRWHPEGDTWQTGVAGCPQCAGYVFIASYGFGW